MSETNAELAIAALVAAGVDTIPEGSDNWLKVAHVHAMLALADQQRLTNELTYYRDTITVPEPDRHEHIKTILLS